MARRGPLNHDILSSSPLAPTSGAKLSAPPSVTPRRFKRFFTPRSTQGARASSGSRSARALQDITAQGTNRRPKQGTTSLELGFEDLPQHTPPKKKRRTSQAKDENFPNSQEVLVSEFGSSPLSSPCRERGRRPLASEEPLLEYPARIRRKKVVYSNFNDSSAATSFTSHPDDTFKFVGDTSLPFSVASSNTTSLVAMGTENGAVVLLDTALDARRKFAEPFLEMKPHDNGIMDIKFSSDDRLLVTASGDQHAIVTDLQTQKPLYILIGHTSSVKQVAFQPGSDNILATSGRDGSIFIWDLRCGTAAASSRFNHRHSRLPGNQSASPSLKHVAVLNSISGAHENDLSRGSAQANARVDVSVTALSFLSTCKSHLFMTASDTAATIKLWDIRGRHSVRSNTCPIPISSTPKPVRHLLHRDYGINSLSISADGARTYALCRDGVIWVYATNHITLGQANDVPMPVRKADKNIVSLSGTRRNKRVAPASSKTGAGPLYGLHCPGTAFSSFYVRGAIRQNANSVELLATGCSSEGNTILFPTEERALANKAVEARFDGPDHEPVYNAGVLLSRGHDPHKEVTGVAWSEDGKLITIGDDFQARCWRNDPVKAHHIRGGGEEDGRRHGWGFAVRSDLDEADNCSKDEED